MRECSAVVVLVEVSLHAQTRTHRDRLSSVNIVLEDSRGAQVEYTGDLRILFRTQRSTAPVP